MSNKKVNNLTREEIKQLPDNVIKMAYAEYIRRYRKKNPEKKHYNKRKKGVI